MKRQLGFGSILVLMLIAAAVAFVQRQWLLDQYHARTVNLQPESAQIATNLELTEPAGFLYRASRPEVQPAGQFNISCKDVAQEHSIVLGCYTAQRFFIYDIDDQRLAGVKEVTAAHELLHAAYERLSSTERRELESILLATGNSIQDKRFKETLEEYRRSEPGQLANELHSILGTEIAVLPQKLEEHYKKYFTNRAKIVTYARQYEQAFTEIESKIKDYDSGLATLKAQKETLESELAAQQEIIEAERSRLNSLRAEDPSGYNQAVPAYNQLIRTYNSSVGRLQQIIETYNRYVQERNSLATTQNDLVKQLDSSYSPLQ